MQLFCFLHVEELLGVEGHDFFAVESEVHGRVFQQVCGRERRAVAVMGDRSGRRDFVGQVVHSAWSGLSESLEFAG